VVSNSSRKPTSQGPSVLRMGSEEDRVGRELMYLQRQYMYNSQYCYSGYKAVGRGFAVYCLLRQSFDADG
jgi:hypothetical protein